MAWYALRFWHQHCLNFRFGDFSICFAGYTERPGLITTHCVLSLSLSKSLVPWVILLNGVTKFLFSLSACCLTLRAVLVCTFVFRSLANASTQSLYSCSLLLYSEESVSDNILQFQLLFIHLNLFWSCQIVFNL